MNHIQWMTLGLVFVGVAAALVAEHYVMKPWHVPVQWRYAVGLLTDMGGILAWAAWQKVTVTWPVAALMLATACLAGAVDAAILFAEQAAERRRWNELQASNAELAARLRVLMSKPTNSRYMRRLREMVETSAFATAALGRERELILLAEAQAQDLLDQIRDIVGQKGAEPFG
jgi:hypothetical protein